MKRHAAGLLLVAAASMFTPNHASARDTWGGVTYNYSFPGVDLDEYVGQDSWYGITVDIRRTLPQNPRVQVGLSSGWYVFYNNVNKVIEIDNISISGEQYRNFNIIPILASLDVQIGNLEGTHPYLGINLGAYYARQQLDIGLWSIDESNWHFGVAPEAGVIFPIRYDSDFYFNARYHYLLESGGYLGDQSLTLPFFTLGVGVAWKY